MENKLKPFSKKAKSLKLGEYEHYKGNKYKVLSVARHSETLEELVVYQALYNDHSIWVRPLDMFLEKVKIDGKIIPRFKHINSKNVKKTEEWTQNFIKRYRKDLEALARK
ncbi:MAG: DUF1653 domain-containing protein [Parcubacteria group bacterium]|uniref:DUF1653 domain-containing protein n=1 Tax=Candidatus Sungiibacteriota bacterium TaxID=2750080 RepID=A0A932DSA6_9BACT|nr:DUF1653 domain-containing protein [Candidatus Sungbacteria bacterium]MBI2466066.1 DUF1653 domain-containing protein [Candidatus Sungbacteria bacterium]MBI4119085.1 DUF1653 domain-containing protein [Parcubacteria group bacterium]